MKIIKLKWGLYGIIDCEGREVAVANSYREAKKFVRRGNK